MLTSVVGYPRIGENRELKFASEKYFKGEIDAAELEGGTGADNARLAIDVLNGSGRPTLKAAVGLNAGAVLYLCGKAKTLKDGYDMAVAAMTNGTALKKLQEIQNVSERLSA